MYVCAITELNLIPMNLESVLYKDSMWIVFYIKVSIATATTLKYLAHGQNNIQSTVCKKWFAI